jgi:hypothetical protein
MGFSWSRDSQSNSAICICVYVLLLLVVQQGKNHNAKLTITAEDDQAGDADCHTLGVGRDCCQRTLEEKATRATMMDACVAGLVFILKANVTF